MRDVSIIEVNLSAIDHNMAVLREMIGPPPGKSEVRSQRSAAVATVDNLTSDVGICPIVKADAYGLGAPRIAKRLNHCGADLLAVYTPEQAGELFRAAVAARVLVLMPVRDIGRVDEVYRALVADRLQLTVHDLDHVGDLLTIADRFGVKMRLHLEVDTGMSRGGCSLAEAPAILKRIAQSPRLELAGLFTHFANADADLDVTEEQMAMFDALRSECAQFIPPSCRVHIASSFAALRSRKFHKSMVRVGLAWAGYGWEWMRDTQLLPQATRLRPCVTWKSRIVQTKTIERGTSVGYGSAWTAKRRSLIGLVPVGYADGYPIGIGAGSSKDRAKGASVGMLLGGDTQPRVFAPVVGAINMDQITIDLTEAAAFAQRRGETINLGTQVELISADPAAPNHLPELARLAGTIPHEMLCRLNPRLKRAYTSAVAEFEPLSTTADALAG